MDRIDIDFGIVMKQADVLENIANDMEKLSEKSFDGALQNTAVNWKGQNATMYLNKGNTLKGNMTTTAQNLKELANSIKSRARFIYQQELKAKAIAASKSH